MDALKLALFLLVIFFCENGVQNARILALFPIPSPSHCILVRPLLKSLAQQGHEVTMISPYPLKEKLPNYRDIHLEKVLSFKKDIMQPIMMYNTSKLQMIIRAFNMFDKIFTLTLENPELLQLQTDEKFDLVIQFGINTQALLGIAHHFNAPVILFSTVGAGPIGAFLGNPAPSSFVPDQMLLLPSKFYSSFLLRLKNTVFRAFSNLVFTLISNYQAQQLSTKYFPNAPSIEELWEEHVALTLLNTHFSIESVRPSLPNMVQIGGIQIEEPKPLPKDLQQFLDEAKDGAIFFSLGSNIQLNAIPPEILGNITSALGKTRLKVLFKSDIDDMANLPTNIKVGKWFPQNDILAHPNVKLFISHGGLLSTTEAVYHGVPILGIPFFGDQKGNVAEAVINGYAVEIYVEDITEELLLQKIKQGLTDSSLRSNIKLKSSLLRNQPMKPLDTALYWVNHVIQYKGADHLKCSGRHLNIFQYYVVDVVGFLVIIAIIAILLFYFVVKLSFRACKKVFCKNQKNKKD